MTNEDLARFWDKAWETAPDEADSFRNELRKYEDAAASFVDRGSMSSVGKSQAHQAYSDYGPGSLTMAEIPRAWRILIQLFETWKRELTCVGEDASEESIYNLGVRLLAIPADEYGLDISWLRLPPTLAPLGAT